MVIIFGIIFVVISILIVVTTIYFMTCLCKVEHYADKNEKAAEPGSGSKQQEYQPNGIMAYKTFSEIAAPLVSSIALFKNVDFYQYRLDGNNMAISDGGGDMYDGGNATRIYIDGQASNSLRYDQTIPAVFTSNSNKRVDHVGMGYSSGNALAYLCKCNQRAQIGFQKTGNLGADGGGIQVTDTVCNRDFLDGYEVYAWRRLVYNAGDPSICDLYFAIADKSSTIYDTRMYGSVGGSTDDGFSQFYMDCTNVLMGCILLSRPSGIAVPVSECKEVIRKMCNVLKKKFSQHDLKGSIDDSFKCKDCMISLLTDTGVRLEEAAKRVEDLLQVRPEEYMALMGQTLEGVPQEVRAQLPAMELNEVISQMRKQVVVNEEGEKIALDTCMVPLTFIQRMMNDSPQHVRLDNNTDINFKILVLGNMTLRTNIDRSLPSDINQLMKVDSVKDYRQEELGAIVDTGDNSYMRLLMIQLFTLSDSETMRTINNLLNRYRTTLNERRIAKENEDTSIRQLSDATRDNNIAQAKATASEKIYNEQWPKTRTAQSKERTEINRNEGALSSEWSKRTYYSYYHAPGRTPWR